MACVNDHSLSENAKKLVAALEEKQQTPEEISATLGLPLFKVRSGLREMVEAGFVTEENGVYKKKK
ncbi:hypothetical protein [Massilibacterium senegalense]|uniref:hypothetical protein n=1 Tax=Massilibacterium senegalense TaxID=1632858 RepID=UPI000784E191|nr:hypothetical protein [Massilibacterium senegalense]